MTLKGLKEEIFAEQSGSYAPDCFRVRGYEKTASTDPSAVRADGIYALFTEPRPFIYKNDLIVGSIRPCFVSLSDEQRRAVEEIADRYPERGFSQNGDHFAPDYDAAVKLGVPGLIEKIGRSKEAHRDDPDAVTYLHSMEKTLFGLRDRLLAHAKAARELVGTDGYDEKRLSGIAANCSALAERAPESFEEGLQLVWMIHSCFVYERRYAMALGRIDRYLFPLYEKDKKEGKLDDEYATELLSNVFVKICENRLRGFDDVVNICIGGVDRDGVCAVTGLTYCVLHAVRDVNMPGPNLSARVTSDCPDEFLDECLKVIGTGLGYPALMNDDVNMAALLRKGYDVRDVRDYCMVGCIENFITGKQPPWVDGRFDPIEYLLDIIADEKTLGGIGTMDGLMKIYSEKLADGAEAYVKRTKEESFVADPGSMTSPFLSCFCDFCIERGRDINMGGAKYPSVHGAALMGIGTISDCLAAIEKVVFTDRAATLSEIKEAIDANFEGYEELRRLLLAAPKYGNNDDFADKYAVWYVKTLSDKFDKYATNDGGPYYVAMAANTSNIYAGERLSATPDGRLAGKPLSDAASPTYGRDVGGVTSTLLSVSKPDYTLCACGTVVNQKFTPSAFRDGNRKKLLDLIRVYFSRGGQEIQINSTSRETLVEAMEDPEKYRSLVVRVSGFSAFYVTLDRDVQTDILSRTQHETT